MVIPVYNAEKYIEKCADSLLQQSYTELELLFVDDGSRDQSWQILKKKTEKDKRIVLLHQQNAGTSAARNRGIEASSGEYLTFVDGDDYVGPDYIASLVEKMEELETDMAVCGLTRVDEKGNCIDKLIPGVYQKYEKEEWVMRISCVACHMYRRELWEKYQIRFGIGVRGEDMPIALFFASVCEKIVTLPNAEYYYVQHEGSAMAEFGGLRKYKLPYDILEETIKKIKKVGIKNGEDNFELFSLRILATFISLAHGAEKEEIKKLKAYIEKMMETYFPKAWKNPNTKLFTKLELPFFQKVSVWILIQAERFHFMGLLLKVACR